MKTLLIILAISLASCATRNCRPSKGSADYAWTVDRVEYTGPGWMIYTHRYSSGSKIKKNSFPVVSHRTI